MVRFTTRTMIACLGLLGAFTPAMAEPDNELKARGVNPADNDTRVDVIQKYNWLEGRAGIFTSTLKYDQRVTPEIGINLELPVLAHFHMPGVRGVPGSSINQTGIGDVYFRVRYIQGFGRFSLGGAVETVQPAATHVTLGAGAYQLNATVLAVYAWSPTLISAVVGKAAQSVDQLRGRAPIQENTARVIQAFVFPEGRYLTLDVKYNFETINQRDRWWETVAELGMMLDARTAGSISYGQRFGDRRDRGALSLIFKRFF